MQIRKPLPRLGYVPGGAPLNVARAIQARNRAARPPVVQKRIIPTVKPPVAPAVDPLWTKANNQVMAFMNPMLARLAAQRVAAETNARNVNPQHVAALQGQLQVGAGKMDESFNRGIVSSSAINDALANRLTAQGGAAQSDLSAKLAQIGAQDSGQIAQTYQGASNAGFATGSADLQRLVGERANAGAYQAKLPGIAALEGNRDLAQALSEMRENFGEQEQGLQDQASEQSFNLWDKLRGEKREDVVAGQEAVAAQQELYVKQKLALQALASTATTNAEKLRFQGLQKQLDRQNAQELARIKAETTKYGVDNKQFAPPKPGAVTGPANQPYISVNGVQTQNPNWYGTWKNGKPVPPKGGSGKGTNPAVQTRLKRNKAVAEINKIFFNPKTQQNRAWVESANTTWALVAGKINAVLDASGIPPTSPVGKQIRVATYKRLGVKVGPGGNPVGWAE